MARSTTAPNGRGNGRRLNTRNSVDQAVKGICDIMRRGNCAGAMQYVPELTWILFLRILDETEARDEEEAAALGIPFRPSLVEPYRWRDWGAPPDALPEGATNQRAALAESSLPNALFDFVNGRLLPYLKGLQQVPNATPRQKVISQVLSGVERVRIDTERNLLDVLDRVHEISVDAVDPTHVFTLSQVYEGLLLKMGEKGNDGGQFFTPREVIRAMVRVIDPAPGETIYDPGCGTGGFLAQAYEHVAGRLRAGDDDTGLQFTELKERSLWGREKENLIYPIALANLVLHGVNQPNLWHGNTLTGDEIYGGLFERAPQTFDVILTNPPLGGKESKAAQTRFAYKTSATQVLFLQHIIDSLGPGGRCAMVVDEGLLFRTNQDAFVGTKRLLLNECDLWCVVSLPAGVFVSAGAGVKTNLLFFTKGQPTRRIWYYDLSDVKVGRRTPLTLEHFQDFFRQLPKRSDSPLSWTVDVEERRQAAKAEADPIDEEAKAKDREAAEWKERLAALKKSPKHDKGAIAVAEEQRREVNRQARALRARAKATRNSPYDLKAVNPHKKPVVDTRTPEELLAVVEGKGREVAQALGKLRALLV